MPVPAEATVWDAQVFDVADMIAQSPTFIAKVAPDDPAAHVAIAVDERGSVPRPRAIVCTPRELVLDDLGYASGALVVVFEMDVPEEFRATEDSENGPDPSVVYIDFLRFVGGVHADVVAAARNGGHLILRNSKMVQRPWRSNLDEKDAENAALDYFCVMVEFPFGVRGGRGG